VALVFDDEVLDAAAGLPAEPHDIAVDAVATPRRWLRVTPPV
jgi:5-formyltetrahydrofolate cyclo-ligase